MTDTSKFKKTKFPNVYETPSGGHYVRARVTDPSTDKTGQIKKTLDTKDPLEALQWLKAETDRVKSGVASPTPAIARFSDFAAHVFASTIACGDTKSAPGTRVPSRSLSYTTAGP